MLGEISINFWAFRQGLYSFALVGEKDRAATINLAIRQQAFQKTSHGEFFKKTDMCYK
jgi:hypothetical protein